MNDFSHQAAEPAPKGWQEIFVEARKGLEDAMPSAFDNSGSRDYARIVLDSVEDELSALAASTQATQAVELAQAHKARRQAQAENAELKGRLAGARVEFVRGLQAMTGHLTDEEITHLSVAHFGWACDAVGPRTVASFARAVYALATSPAPSASASQAEQKCRTCNGHGLVGYPTGHPDAGAEECPDCKGAGTEQAAAVPAEPVAGLVEARKQADRLPPILETMARTYDGSTRWDSLDGKTCREAAETIRALAAATQARAPASQAVAKIEDGQLIWSRLPKNADALLYTAAPALPASGEAVAWRWRYDAAKRWILSDQPMGPNDEFEVQALGVLRALPASGEAREGWVSVEDRLPEDGADVWVSTWAWDEPERGQRIFGHATFSAPARWIGTDSQEASFDWYTPTHWMPIEPIPAAPTTTQETKNG